VRKTWHNFSSPVYAEKLFFFCFIFKMARNLLTTKLLNRANLALFHEVLLSDSTWIQKIIFEYNVKRSNHVTLLLQMPYYLLVYGALSVASILLSLSSNGIGQYAGARARRVLHDYMLYNILRCPVRFFECTPVGRIINCFSTDMSIIDKVSDFMLFCYTEIFKIFIWIKGILKLLLNQILP
jgi:ABC-type multidrug transport system fused ATPase/permease subunit